MSHHRRVALLLVMAVLLGPARLGAQESDAAPASEPVVAPVILDGDTLFSVRGISSFPAERRAARIADAIRTFAADRDVPVETLAVEETALGIEDDGVEQAAFLDIVG